MLQILGVHFYAPRVYCIKISRLSIDEDLRLIPRTNKGGHQKHTRTFSRSKARLIRSKEMAYRAAACASIKSKYDKDYNNTI